MEAPIFAFAAVIPAKAGIQGFTAARPPARIPTFAGMTARLFEAR